jgi:uncharacterized membrane protein
MSFTTPVALLLLLVIPAALYLGWPRYAYRRSRDIASLVLRTLILLMLVFALAGLQTVQSADKLGVVFLIDVSDSVGQSARESELTYVRDAISHMAPDDLAGVVVFGANATVERQLNAVRELGPVRSTPITSNTDLAEAVRLGLALFPPNTARRLVVLSDGQPTVGDTDAAARLAAAAGVEISYVPVVREHVPDVLVTDVRVPAEVNAGQEFDLNLSVEAEQSTPATITVFASGEIIHREDVSLEQGTNNYALPLTAGGSGFRDFRVQVEPQNADGFFQNNQLSTFSQVVGPPRVLLIANDETESQYLSDALTQSGLTVDVVKPNQLPIGVEALIPYNSVILDNIPATQLSNRRMEILRSYVRDLGGGLVVVGGPNTYGPGGYFETPLEETLPVDTRLTDQQRVPQLTIAYVIDRSGSMTAVGPSGVENLELAKEAIIRSIDFLQPTDRAGVVSFDTDGFWIADVQPVLDKLGLQNLVGTIRAGGGTDILAGMNTAAQTLGSDPSPRKHIILLTDGGADPGGLLELTADLYENHDVTTSVVSIGAGAPSQTFLDEMAEAGGGNYHPVDVVEAIPTIFTLETVLATRSYIIEEPFVPTIASNSPMIEGITSAPQLLGYVATSPKQTAQVVLTGPTDHNDPLLASWQYGLGRSVAFTSDATARWAENWVSWDEFSRFWSQVVRWTITEGTNNNLETRVVMEGEQARVVVDARDADGNFLNGLNLTTSMVDPNLGAASVPLRQVAPGRYEATFTPDAEGAYFLAVAGQSADDSAALQLDQRTGWVMSYSPEYSVSAQADTSVLSDMAALTGGRSLADDPPAVFAHNLKIETASTPLWPVLLLAALLLLPLDIAVRRLIVTRSDLMRVRHTIMRGAAVAEAPSERLAGLMGAKARAQQKAGEQAAESGSTASILRSRRDGARNGQGETSSPPAASTSSSTPTPRAPAPPSPGQVPPGETGNIAGKLLQKRKERER